MKHLPRHTLLLLSVFLHCGSCAGDGPCVPLFVSVGENTTISYSITDADQDGVYMYRQADVKTVETVLYYYKGGTLTPELPYTGRLETNGNFRNFSVSIQNVSEHDGGVYWCRFNKVDAYTFSGRICLLVQSGTIQTCAGKTIKNHLNHIYLYVIGGLSLILLILVVVLVKRCCDRGNYAPKQQPSNGVYEVMHGHNRKLLTNPAYESSQRCTR